MKPYIFIVFLFTLLACKKENTPKIVLDEKVDLTTATEKAKGTFSNGPYGSASGMAKIYTTNNGQQLALENFSSSNGPSLFVYLSKEKDPVNFINLGSLKAIGGNQLYDIPSGTKASDFKYALIYCKQFSHLFGVAELN